MECQFDPTDYPNWAWIKILDNAEFYLNAWLEFWLDKKDECPVCGDIDL